MSYEASRCSETATRSFTIRSRTPPLHDLRLGRVRTAGQTGGSGTGAPMIGHRSGALAETGPQRARPDDRRDRKSTRLNSSHEWISYAVFCLKKKNRRKNNKARHTVRAAGFGLILTARACDRLIIGVVLTDDIYAQVHAHVQFDLDIVVISHG